MAKMEMTIGPKMIEKIKALFVDAVEGEVTARTRKYKTSNESLRKELAAAKTKIAGLEAEFKPQVERANVAEGTVEHLTERLAELKVTVEALQAQNAKMAKAAKK